jgi:small subunit ribosomal protein S17
MIGTVLSNRMKKTIVVEVGRTAVHAVFKKTVRRFSRFKAHDEKNEAKIGDVVKIRETKPLSKDKRWRLVGIVEKAES